MTEKTNPAPIDLESDILNDLSELLSEEPAAGSDFDFSELHKLLNDEVETSSLDRTEKSDIPPKKKSAPKLPVRKKAVRYGTVAAAAVVLCALLGIFIGRALDPFENRILPNTTIGAVDVGGMTRTEAKKALQTTAGSTICSLPMEITLPDGTITLLPEETKVSLNAGKAVSAAYRLGRKGTAEEKKAAVKASQADGIAVDTLPFLKVDESIIRTRLEAYAAEHNVAHTELRYQLSGTAPELGEAGYDPNAPTQTLELTLGTPLEELDVEAVLSDVLNAYSRHTLSVVISSIPYQTTPQEPDLNKLYEEFYTAPVNTEVDMETFQLIPGSYGYALDMEAAQQLLKTAEYGQTVSIPMVCIPPDILGEKAFFRDELGYCETKHTNNENRNTNLRLACAAMDGKVLQPGEEFSFNGTVGQRTKEGGYKAAAAYSGYNTVDTIGGGICQVSTTLYNAALLADMEIVFRVNHGFRSGYIGIGLDATVSWPNPDMKFRNTSNFPVMIKAEVSDGLVKIKLLGIDDKDYYVKMTAGYSEDEDYITSWSYRNKYDKETNELISKEKEAFSRYINQ